MKLSDLKDSQKVLFPHSISPTQVQWFREQGMDMDDWDFMVITPAESMSCHARDGDLSPSYSISLLLGNRPGSSATWQLVSFEEGLFGVGVVYHA